MRPLAEAIEPSLLLSTTYLYHIFFLISGLGRKDITCVQDECLVFRAEHFKETKGRFNVYPRVKNVHSLPIMIWSWVGLTMPIGDTIIIHIDLACPFLNHKGNIHTGSSSSGPKNEKATARDWVPWVIQYVHTGCWIFTSLGPIYFNDLRAGGTFNAMGVVLILQQLLHKVWISPQPGIGVLFQDQCYPYLLAVICCWGDNSPILLLAWRAHEVL